MGLFKESHVMIFDDDIFMSKLIESVLISFDVGTISVVNDPEEARMYVRSNSIDGVILEWIDWDNPNLDFLDYIRKSGKVKNSKIPVIMCTGHTDYPQIIKARDAGANEVVAKPIIPAQIFDKLYNAVFKQREFISAETFTGPDRRRHSGPYEGEDRRAGQAMAQSDIDQLMVEKDA